MPQQKLGAIEFLGLIQMVDLRFKSGDQSAGEFILREWGLFYFFPKLQIRQLP